MVEVVGISGGTLTWYVSRATGVVSLVFLTVSVLLGILTSFRWSSPNWPRFVVEFVHRNVSLLIVAFVAVHVVVVVADSFAPIGVLDAVIPFISAYRPLWLGFGALAFDLVVALVVTSLLRHRLGYRTWRVVHWLAYLCWPVAVLHGLGTGTDTTSGLVLVLTAACVVAVLGAAALRLGAGLAARPGARVAGLGLLAIAPVALVVWVVAGPLASGWARRAGTPETVLAAFREFDLGGRGRAGADHRTRCGRAHHRRDPALRVGGIQCQDDRHRDPDRARRLGSGHPAPDR